LISKVLIAFDGTECAIRALDFGLNLAQKYSASVLIINVLELPVYGTPDDSLTSNTGLAGFVKDLRSSHQKILNNALERAANLYPQLNVNGDLREGNPSDQIVTVASEGAFDVIVLGHGSESRVREMFLGGNSERVAHLARCSVLIVK
jgi:nucleotide-binding universal stress UspA family protein